MFWGSAILICFRCFCHISFGVHRYCEKKLVKSLQNVELDSGLLHRWFLCVSFYTPGIMTLWWLDSNLAIPQYSALYFMAFFWRQTARIFDLMLTKVSSVLSIGYIGLCEKNIREFDALFGRELIVICFIEKRLRHILHLKYCHYISLLIYLRQYYFEEYQFCTPW